MTRRSLFRLFCCIIIFAFPATVCALAATSATERHLSAQATSISGNTLTANGIYSASLSGDRETPPETRAPQASTANRLLSGTGGSTSNIFSLVFILLLAYFAFRSVRAIMQRKNNKTASTASGAPAQKAPDTIDTRAASAWAYLRSTSAPEELASDANAPADFSKEDFLDGARLLFSRMQTSWAARDLDDIEPFATAGMMDTLREHAKKNPETASVEVLLVKAELIDVQREGPEEKAKVLFSALIQDKEEDKPTETREVWHFTHDYLKGSLWQLDGIEPVTTNE